MSTPKTIEGIVEQIYSTDAPFPVWWHLQVAGQKEVIVHHNRVKELGELKKGDKVRYVEAKSQYSNDARTYVSKLERVE